jgi:hypothetical protein
MNLIKLSAVLYPSLPGPKRRRLPFSLVNGIPVTSEPLKPVYFGEEAWGRIYAGVMIIVLLGLFLGFLWLLSII